MTKAAAVRARSGGRWSATFAAVAVAAAARSVQVASEEAAAAGALAVTVAAGALGATLAVLVARRVGARATAVGAALVVAVLALVGVAAAGMVAPLAVAAVLFAAALAVAAVHAAAGRWIPVVTLLVAATTAVWPWGSDVRVASALAAAATLVAAVAAAGETAAPRLPSVWWRAVATVPIVAAVAIVVVGLASAPGPIAAIGFAAVASAAAALATTAMRTAAWVVAAALGVAWSMTVAPGVGAGERLLAHAGGEAIVVARGDGSRWWRARDGARGVVGPERASAALAATAVFAATRRGDRVLALGDAIALAPALAALDERVVDAVDDRLVAVRLRAAMASDGCVPVAPPVGARPSALAAAMRRLPTGARQAIVVGVLPTPAGPLVSAAAQRELARVAADGVVAQPFVPSALSPSFLVAWLDRAAAAFPWTAVFVVGDDAVLLGAAQPLQWPSDASAAWPTELRWLAHRAHLGDGDDLAAASLGALDRAALAAAASAVDGATALRQSCRGPGAVPARGSLLAAWRAQRDALAAAVDRVRKLPADPAGRAEAAAWAARFLPIGAPRAELQAALGLVGADGVALVEPARAARRGAAISPTLFHDAPAALAALPRPTVAIGPLEDIASLPPPARLAELAAGDEPLAVALRARFPSPCARAFVAALAAGPLATTAQQALRELADPFVLREAAAVLAPAGRLREALGLWRGGLPMPPALTALARGDGDDRRALAVALAGRREPSCAPALAELLVADERDVLVLAAAALELQFPGVVDFDPTAPLSVRRAAADRVRSLHNRAP